ncbi:hypothetical protein VCHA50O402_20809 [Vibrio chagasii]|nr:hypothetical protein VCHA51O444_160105 [Vibrio chagasii]CAH7139944.1 hypothetical protein VCHA50O402_20809 [Vibrio chagasii]
MLHEKPFNYEVIYYFSESIFSEFSLKTDTSVLHFSPNKSRVR